MTCAWPVWFMLECGCLVTCSRGKYEVKGSWWRWYLQEPLIGSGARLNGPLQGNFLFGLGCRCELAGERQLCVWETEVESLSGTSNSMLVWDELRLLRGFIYTKGSEGCSEFRDDVTILPRGGINFHVKCPVPYPHSSNDILPWWIIYGLEAHSLQLPCAVLWSVTRPEVEDQKLMVLLTTSIPQREARLAVSESHKEPCGRHVPSPSRIRRCGWKYSTSTGTWMGQ
jgi:hypothetical protein